MDLSAVVYIGNAPSVIAQSIRKFVWRWKVLETNECRVRAPDYYNWSFKSGYLWNQTYHDCGIDESKANLW